MDPFNEPDLDLVRVAAPQVTDPTPATLATARAALLERLATETSPYTTLSASSPLRRQRRRKRQLLAATALVGAAALAVVAVPVLDLGLTRVSATADAREFLLTSASQAAEQNTPDARNATFWYVSSRISGEMADEGEREVWLGRREQGQVVTRLSEGSTGRALPLNGPANFFGLSWAELFALPTDTDELRERIYTLAGDSGPDPDSEAFVVVGDLLRESPAPPAVRAALLRVVATIPNVELGNPTTDTLGRHIVPVVRTSSGLTERLLFGADNGQLLGEDTVVARGFQAPEPAMPGPDATGAPGAPVASAPTDHVDLFAEGSVLYRSTVLLAAPVDELGQRPNR